MGLGVAISLFLAILVLALANSSLRVCGFSGSKRIPYKRKEGMEGKDFVGPDCPLQWVQKGPRKELA